MRGNKEGSYVQCTHCGCIEKIQERLEEYVIYIDFECRACGNARGLNIGKDILDQYELYDVTLDSRYYYY